MGKKWWPALWRNWMPNPHGMRVLATGMASTCTIRCMYIPMLPVQDSPAQEHDILDTSDDITTQLFRKPSSHQSMSPQPGSASAETRESSYRKPLWMHRVQSPSSCTQYVVPCTFNTQCTYTRDWLWLAKCKQKGKAQLKHCSQAASVHVSLCQIPHTHTYVLSVSQCSCLFLLTLYYNSPLSWIIKLGNISQYH